MAKSIYTALHTDVTSILKEMGSRCTIETSDKKVSGYAVFLEDKSDSEQGTSILKDTKTVYFSGKDRFDPINGDYLHVGKETFAVVSVEKVAPDLVTTIYFKMEVKQ